MKPISGIDRKRISVRAHNHFAIPATVSLFQRVDTENGYSKCYRLTGPAGSLSLVAR